MCRLCFKIKKNCYAVNTKQILCKNRQIIELLIKKINYFNLFENNSL